VADHPVRIGCSGWNYRDWRGRLYPEGLPAKRWLGRYAECFDTVEVNATFYRLPARDAVARWAEQTPPGFLFAVKSSRYLTHVRRLRDIGEGMDLFGERIEPLAAAGRLGPILWQLPPNFRRDDERLEDALASLSPGRHAFEFRHESWFVPETIDRLRRRGVALVIGHHPKRPWQTFDVTSDFTFVRFHFGARGRRGNYSASELDEWAEHIRELRRQAEVLAYFNNDWEGFAVRNALGLKARLGLGD
jgi:uncharacterized protein YecE (DUF72 family)